jgi:hypothetical protein
MRSLIVKWEGLGKVHCEGDRLSVFVPDSRTSRLKLLDLYVSEVAHEGDASFEEEYEEAPESIRPPRTML